MSFSEFLNRLPMTRIRTVQSIVTRDSGLETVCLIARKWCYASTASGVTHVLHRLRLFRTPDKRSCKTQRHSHLNFPTASLPRKQIQTFHFDVCGNRVNGWSVRRRSRAASETIENHTEITLEIYDDLAKVILGISSHGQGIAPSRLFPIYSH